MKLLTSIHQLKIRKLLNNSNGLVVGLKGFSTQTVNG